MGEEVEIRLSVAQLHELIERAQTENFMLVHDARFQWVKIIPYYSEEKPS